MVEAKDDFDTVIPPRLMADLEALALVDKRPARDMIREAVECYLRDRQTSAEVSPQTSPLSQRRREDAANRLLELRKGNLLPRGMTLRDMIDHGRA